MTTRYFLYARKSSEGDDRQVASIGDQIAEMRQVAERKGLTIIKVFEEARSAKKPGRPVFMDMMKRIRKGEANGILCWKLNRLARNVFDGGEITGLLQDGVISSIQTSHQLYRPDDNVLMMLVEFGVATQFVKDLSRDVKRGLRRKAFNGWLPANHLPIGYMHNRNKESGQDLIIPDPDRFHIVKELWDMFKTGAYSISEIRATSISLGLRNKHGASISYSTIHRMFKNPFYYGYFHWKNDSGEREIIEGKHMPLISKTDFNIVQDILSGRSRKTRPQRHIFPYRGLISCGECGGSVTAEKRHRATCSECKSRFSILKNKNCPKCRLHVDKMQNPTIFQTTYYKCTKWKKMNCSQKVVSQKSIDEKIYSVLKRRFINSEFYKWAKMRVQKDKKRSQKDSVVLSTLQKKRSEVTSKKKRLLDLHVSGEINKPEYNDLLEEYNGKIAELSKQIEKRISDNARIQSSAENYLDAIHGDIEKFENASATDQKKIIKAVVKNLKILNREVHFETREPLKFFPEVQSRLNVLNSLSNH